MNWRKEHTNFGVLKIDGRNVKVYKNTFSYDTINVYEDIQDAKWSGDVIVVTLKNGKTRRYDSTTNYKTV